MCPLESNNRDSKFRPNFESRHFKESGPFLKTSNNQKPFILFLGQNIIEELLSKK